MVIKIFNSTFSLSHTLSLSPIGTHSLSLSSHLPIRLNLHLMKSHLRRAITLSQLAFSVGVQLGSILKALWNLIQLNFQFREFRLPVLATEGAVFVAQLPERLLRKPEDPGSNGLNNSLIRYKGKYRMLRSRLYQKGH